MFFEEVEVGRVHKSGSSKIITKTEVGLVARFAGAEMVDKKPSKRGGGRDNYKCKVLNRSDQVVLESVST